jgi:hypothetical protein
MCNIILLLNYSYMHLKYLTIFLNVKHVLLYSISHYLLIIELMYNIQQGFTATVIILHVT